MSNVQDVLIANRDRIVSEYQSGASTVTLGEKYGCSNASVYLFLRDRCGIKPRQVAHKYDDLIPDAMRRLAAGESVACLSRETGIPRTTLAREAAKRGQPTSTYLKRCPVRLKDHADEIEAMYEANQSMARIASHFGCDESCISRLLKQRGVKTRFHYEYDESFFDVIDSEEKAYTLGFFVADGCNNINHAMAISVVDRDVLEKIKAAMRYTGPISKRPAPKRLPHHKEQYMLSIASPHIAGRLTELGCPVRKTFVTRFPTDDEIPDDLLRHYIRGVFDGDGWVHKSTNGWHMGVAGTKALLEPMRQHIYRETGVMMGLYPQGKIHVIKVGGNFQVPRVLDWLYKDATIFLDRKYERYLTMKQEIGSYGLRR